MHDLKIEKRQRALIWIMLPLVIYSLIGLVITWPLVTQLDSHAAGTTYGDTYMMLRQGWDAREAVLSGRNPLKQTLLVYPDGFTSRLMWSTPLRWVPVMLLSLVLTPVLAFNMWLIGSLVLNGTTAYWLGMELSGRRIPAALLGGLVFMTFPTMQGHLAVGHIDVLAMYGLPLFALCAWRVLQSGAGWRTVCWGGACFALACLGLTSQVIYNLMPVVLGLGLYYVMWERGKLVQRGHAWHEQPWVRIGAMVGLGGVILLIFFGPLLTSAGRAEISTISETGRVTFSADVLAFASPSLFGPLAERGLVPAYARDVLGTNMTEGAAYLGVVALVLVLIGVFTRREARPWLVVALVAAVFSLGPLLKWRDAPVQLRFEDVHSYITLPWAFLQNLPVFEATRTPGRFNGATALAWGALVSVGMGAVLRRLPVPLPHQAGDGRLRRMLALGLSPGVLVIILGAMTLVEYQLFWPFPTLDTAQPDYFRELAQADDVRAVLNLPVNHALVQMEAMAQQIVHGQPMIAGQLYRRSPQNPAVLAVLGRTMLGADVTVFPPFPQETVPVLLSAAGADRVIVHKQFIVWDVAAVLEWLEGALGPSHYEDERIAVFAVPRNSEVPYNFEFVVSRSATDWTPLEVFGNSSDYLSISFMADQGTWYFYNNVPYGDLVFHTLSFYTPHRVTAWLDGHLISRWVAQGEEMRLPVWIAPGFHTLRFETEGGCDPLPFDINCIIRKPFNSCERLEVPQCVSVWFDFPTWEAAEQRRVSLEVDLDHRVRLRGYSMEITVSPEDADLSWRKAHIRLFWAAEQSLPEDYALFVHIADPETAEPLAQYDGFPLVPTTEWGTDSRWQSMVELMLPPDLPAGKYAVNVGWFNPETSERVAVKGDRRWAAAGMIHLGIVTIP